MHELDDLKEIFRNEAPVRPDESARAAAIAAAMAHAERISVPPQEAGLAARLRNRMANIWNRHATHEAPSRPHGRRQPRRAHPAGGRQPRPSPADAASRGRARACAARRARRCRCRTEAECRERRSGAGCPACGKGQGGREIGYCRRRLHRRRKHGGQRRRSGGLRAAARDRAEPRPLHRHHIEPGEAGGNRPALHLLDRCRYLFLQLRAARPDEQRAAAEGRRARGGDDQLLPL